MGMLIVKKLISYDPSKAQQISSFPLSILPETGPDSTCLDALNYFQQGRSHILLVSTTPGREGGAIGVVSLEDVIEEMIGEEIVDETVSMAYKMNSKCLSDMSRLQDLYVDLHNKIKVVRGPARRVAAGKALAPLIQGVIERRQVYRTSSHNYGSTNTDSPAPHVPPPAKAFQKVVVKGAGSRRTAFGNGVDASQLNTPFGSPPNSTVATATGSGTSTPGSIVRAGRSISRSRDREAGNSGDGNDERRPLLRRNSNDGS